jgi:cytidylate kinase
VEGLEFRFVADGERPRLLMNGEDVSRAIRTPEMSAASSRVSRWPAVRSALVGQQRRFGAGGGIVMEGRDIGTVVFPDAEVKIYLTASAEERARRRTEELGARGEDVDPARVLADVIERDRRDSEREHSPLRPADDAVEFVTDGLSVEQVVDGLERIARERTRR